MKIFYKILNTLLVLAIIPVLLFLPMFKFIARVGIDSSNQILSLIGSFVDVDSIIKNAVGIDFASLPETYTLKAAYDMLLSDSSALAGSGLDASALPEEMTKWFTAAGALFIAALAVAVIVLLIGLLTKKTKLCIVFSALSLALTFGAGKCFDHIASQLVSGKISLIPVLEKLPALESYAAYLDYVNFDIRLLELGSAFTMVAVILGALLLLNIVFTLAKGFSE